MTDLLWIYANVAVLVHITASQRAGEWQWEGA